jgi:hypothetical protein
VSVRGLLDAAGRLAEGYRLLFGVGAIAVVLAQTLLTTNIAGWAEPWVGSLALTVAVLGMVSMLSSQGQAPNTKLWLSCALGCAASAACFAIVAWRAEVDTAVAWPMATLAGIATAVLVGFSEASGQGTAGAAATADSAPEFRAHRWALPAGIAQGGITLTLAATTLALNAWSTDAGWYQPARIVAGSLYVIAVPGWYLSSLFDGTRFDLIQRATLAVALSLVAVPLGLMWLDFLGGHIDFWAVWALVLALALLGAVLNWARSTLLMAAQEHGPARTAGLLTSWSAWPVGERAVLLSAVLWLLAVGGLATRVGI